MSPQIPAESVCLEEGGSGEREQGGQETHGKKQAPWNRCLGPGRPGWLLGPKTKQRLPQCWGQDACALQDSSLSGGKKM